MIISTIPASNCTPQTIVIGRRGTYDTMQIAFDLSYLVESYGNGVAVLAVKRSQDSSAYPAVVTQEDNTLTWTVSETDTYYVGSGECQLMWYVDGGLAKTIIYPMVVMRDILQTAEEPPDGYENWIERLTELGAETQQNAQNAAQSASDASTAKDDAVTAKEAAEAAQEAAETAVTHYPKIENNYWMVWDVASQSYVSTGIQADGDDGYSPEVTITSITGGHRVTITDKDHPQGQSFDVMDGQGGGGGTSDYTGLTNKPQINGHTLSGNQSAADLGLGTYSKPASGIPKTDLAQDVQTSLGKADSALQTAPVTSVNSKTGAVTLGAGDVGFNSSEEYNEGTVGAELQHQSRHLNDLDDDKQDAPATAGTAGQVLSLDSQLNPVWADQTGGGLTDTQKHAILNCFEHVAWTDASGATYYNELEAVFFPAAELVSISATYQNSEDVYPDTALDDLRPYITVTAIYDDATSGAVSAYTITGTLTVGSSVLTIGYNGKTTTITVTVTEPGRSDMDEWSDGVPYTDLEVVQNSYYNNGSISSYNGWDRTGKFFVHGAAKLIVSRESGSSSSDNYSFFFDENGTKIGNGFAVIRQNEMTNTITVPSEAYYIGISATRGIIESIIDHIVPYAE